MQSLKIEVLVGVFLLLSLLCLGFLAVKVSGFSLGKSNDRYLLYAHFEQVGGLTVRSKVAISGVEVGQVLVIEYDQKTLNAKVTLEIDSSVSSIPIDSTASILTEGLLGSKYISISLGAEDQTLSAEDEIFDTQSAVILEELIGKFLIEQF